MNSTFSRNNQSYTVWHRANRHISECTFVLWCEGSRRRDNVMPFQNLLIDNGSVDYLVCSWTTNSSFMYLGSHGLYCHQTSWSLSSSYGEYLKDYIYRDRVHARTHTHTQNARAETCHSGWDCDHISRAIAQILLGLVNCVQKCVANEGGNQDVIIKNNK